VAMARLLMCRYNRSPLLTWQAPHSRRGHTGTWPSCKEHMALPWLGRTPTLLAPESGQEAQEVGSTRGTS
jgi:hypothetical protein